jgi:hypothetical protein
MKKMIIYLIFLSTIVLTLTGRADASMILFDDKLASGWSGTWRMSAESSNVYSGTGALCSSNGQFVLSSRGLTVGDDYWLEAMVNTTNATASNIEVFLSYANQTNIPFDNRDVPTTYYLNGIGVLSGNKGILTDNAPSTWQLLRIDLTQTTYTGWPYTSHAFNPQVDELLQVRFVGSSQLLLDDLRLIPKSVAMETAIPEPATIGLLGLGALILLFRKIRPPKRNL